MLSASKLDKLTKDKGLSASVLVDSLTKAGLTAKVAKAAVKNWSKGLMKPKPRTRDIEALASALGVQANDVSEWRSTIKYAPGSPRKARLVSQLIAGRGAQEALDLLKFTNKRAAYMIEKALKSAIASADEAAADIENLYVSSARIDGAGVRLGTKRWIPKDRGRANPIRKESNHIHVTVAEVD